MRKGTVNILMTISGYLVRGFFMLFSSLILLTVSIGVLGFPHESFSLFSSVLPWLLRLGIILGCFLMLTSISEAI